MVHAGCRTILVATFAVVSLLTTGTARAASTASDAVTRHTINVQRIVDRTQHKIDNGADNTVHVIQRLDSAGVSDAVISMTADRGLTRVRRFADQGLSQIDRQTRIALWSVNRGGGGTPEEMAIQSAARNARVRIESAVTQAETRINAALP